MANPAKQIATQLANIEAVTGMTVDDFVSTIADAELHKHGAIIAFLKAEHGMSHGNANLIAHQVREQMAGGPPPPAQLLDA